MSANISIELKVGASKILLEQSGITIEAPTITIKSLRQGNADKHQLRSDEPSMSQVRFATVRDLFNSFPSAFADVGAADEDLNSLDSFDASLPLMEARHFILCHLLPRRAAVAWASRSIRRMLSAPRPDEDRMLGFAEAWVEGPEEPRRRKVLSARHAGRRQIARDVGCAGRRLVWW